MHKVLFLAGYTSRSQAYAQAMAKFGMAPGNTLLFGEEKGNLSGQTSFTQYEKIKDTELFIPDLRIPLIEILKIKKWNYQTLHVDHVNSPDINDYLIKLRPSLVIYYGSQIVSSKILKNGIPFLHLHSGWLPDYRGSTTFYYSWLKENICAVTALILDENIDTGPIVARKKYPIPQEDIDPDYLFDPAIRADLLISVLKTYIRHGEFPEIVPQPKEGTDYYKIHPVLKHLARLRK